MLRARNKIKIVNSLMFLASEEPRHIIPTSNVRAAAFSEFVNGTISYLGEKPANVFPKPNEYEFAQLEKELWAEFKKIVEPSSKIPNALKKHFLELADVSVDGGTAVNDASINCDFYFYYSHLFGLSPNSRMSMTCEHAYNARQFLASMQGDERKTLEQIGINMQPLLKKNLEYIAKHYSY